MSMHPLTDQLPDYLDALALRQACGEIEERVTRERDEERAEAASILAELEEQKETAQDESDRWREIAYEELETTLNLMAIGGAGEDENFYDFATRVFKERDALRAEVEACGPYLKEGETPAERIQREIDDNAAVLSLLAKSRAEVERLRAALSDVQYHCVSLADAQVIALQALTPAEVKHDD
jgi:hypothetical protein